MDAVKYHSADSNFVCCDEIKISINRWISFKSFAASTESGTDSGFAWPRNFIVCVWCEFEQLHIWLHYSNCESDSLKLPFLLECCVSSCASLYSTGQWSRRPLVPPVIVLVGSASYNHLRGHGFKASGVIRMLATYLCCIVRSFSGWLVL